MKTVALGLLFFGGVITMYGQGTVNFSNQSTALSSPPDRLVRFDSLTVGTNSPNPFGTNGAPVVGSNFVAQLFYGASTASEDSLVPVSTAPARFRASTSIVLGTWAPGTRTLTGFNLGDTVTFQVRVWDSTFASSWDEYVTVRQGLAGVSPTFTYFQCSVACPPSDNGQMFNFQGFTIGIPEPSSLSLCVLAFFVAIQVRRSKCGSRVSIGTSRSRAWSGPAEEDGDGPQNFEGFVLATNGLALKYMPKNV